MRRSLPHGKHVGNLLPFFLITFFLLLFFFLMRRRYHVANMFAPSSRSGSPDDLKELIDECHAMGVSVLLDIVHSHAAKNVIDGVCVCV
jgi:hypothetical protein